MDPHAGWSSFGREFTDARGRLEDASLAGNSRISALPQRRLEYRAGPGAPFLLGATRVRGGAGGYSRDGTQRRGVAGPRILRAGVQRWRGGDRVAGRAKLVQW